MSNWKQRKKKGIKPKSKGMRKHIRRQKTLQRKNEFQKQRQRQT